MTTNPSYRVEQELAIEHFLSLVCMCTIGLGKINLNKFLSQYLAEYRQAHTDEYVPFKVFLRGIIQIKESLEPRLVCR